MKSPLQILTPPASLCVAVAALTLCIGCGGDSGPIRRPMAGVVMSDDIDPPLNGTIAFLPAGGTQGPAANGLVENGRYQFDTETGPVTGTHRVLIDLQPPRDKMASDDADSGLQWKFEFEVDVPDSPPYESSFQVERKATDADQ